MGNTEIDLETPELYYTYQMIDILLRWEHDGKNFVSPEDLEKLKQRCRRTYI